MAHNTKSILVDVNGKPIPQYFDPLADEYKPLLGQHGAARSILYGPDGSPISDTNKLPVRAADLETLIGALNDSAVTNPANAASVIAALKGLLSVVGTEATLGQILSALAPLATESTLSSLASAVAKETTLAQVLSALGALATETTLDGVKSAVDTLAGTVADGAQKVTLTGRKVTETLLSRAVRTASVRTVLSPPDWARGAVFVLRMYGATGSFGPEQGARLLLLQKTTATTAGGQTIASVEHKHTTSMTGHQAIWVHPGANVEGMVPSDGRQIKSVSVDLRGGIWELRLAIIGTFGPGEGIDAEVFATWMD